MRVFDLLPDGLQQAGVVGGGRDGLSADVLHRAEGLRPEVQVVETLLQQGVGVASHLGVWERSPQYVTSLRLKRDHMTAVLKSPRWLPARFRIDLKVLVLVFKCLNGLRAI